MAKLPLGIYNEAQTRALDRYASEDAQIPSFALMTRAGEAGLHALRSCWPGTERIVVLCGPGNNGGDGYVLARAAVEQRLNVKVVALTDPTQLSGDAQRAWLEFRSAGGVAIEWSDDVLAGADVIVDAIFGIGLKRPVSGTIAACIDAVNASAAHVLSLDVPSGLASDTGHVMGNAVRAERTIAFLGLKLGFYLGEGPNYTGIMMCDGLDVPAAAFESIAPSALRIDDETLAKAFPRRSRTTHKGQQGHVLVIAGGEGMGGAARLSGEAALRVGSGLVTIATRPDNVAAITAGRPELICRAPRDGAQLMSLVERADVVAIGPGLGQDDWSHAMMAGLAACDKPTVVDADALNSLAQTPRSRTNWILTPHPGEAGRLLGVSAADIQRDRLEAAQRISERYGGVVALKGAGTLVIAPGEVPSICDRGNPGMASPGMGDVLTGVIAGVLAQGSSCVDAARAGVLVHAMAGDMAANRGERGILASDLFNYLPACVNPNQYR